MRQQKRRRDQEGEFGGLGRNRTTDTRIFNPVNVSERLLVSLRNVTIFLFLGPSSPLFPNLLPNFFGPVGCIAIAYFEWNQGNTETDLRTCAEPIPTFLVLPLGSPGLSRLRSRWAYVACRLRGANCALKASIFSWRILAGSECKTSNNSATLSSSQYK